MRVHVMLSHSIRFMQIHFPSPISQFPYGIRTIPRAFRSVLKAFSASNAMLLAIGFICRRIISLSSIVSSLEAVRDGSEQSIHSRHSQPSRLWHTLHNMYICIKYIFAQHEHSCFSGCCARNLKQGHLLKFANLNTREKMPRSPKRRRM